MHAHSVALLHDYLTDIPVRNELLEQAQLRCPQAMFSHIQATEVFRPAY